MNRVSQRLAPLDSPRPAILITGAAAGIGRACAELFVQRGWFVGLYDLNEVGVAALGKELGPNNATWGSLNVTNPQDWARVLLEFSERSNQRLDVLMNNAGILSTGEFSSLNLDAQLAMVDVNLKGLIIGCHAAFPYLKATPGAHVINMASATAMYGQPDLSTYSATKFAVRGLSEGLDLEWQKVGIRVSDIWPSFVNTAMAKSFGKIASAQSLGIRLTAQDVAQRVWQCANSKPLFHQVHWTVGWQTWLLSLGTRLAPQAITRQIVKHLSH